MKTRWLNILAVGALLSMPLAATRAQTAPPPAAAKPVVTEDTDQLLKRVLDGQRNLELKLADLQKKLDSISQFLGDQRSSSFDSVDRRLRNIEDDIKDLKR